MEPPPSTEVISFDWNRLEEPLLPSFMPFQIIVQVCDKIIYYIIVDEGDYFIILSSTTWKYMVSPQLVLDLKMKRLESLKNCKCNLYVFGK
jgi:hypothetical protein